MAHKKPADSGVLAKNRRARYEYELLETFEAGIALRGTEVKSIRDGRVQLRDAYVEVQHGEAWLVAAHISPYSHGNRENHEPERKRKLLLNRRELDRLYGQTQVKGLTIVPLSLYLVGNKIKLELALGRGKKLHDKRAAEKEKLLDREAEESMAQKNW